MLAGARERRSSRQGPNFKNVTNKERLVGKKAMENMLRVMW